MIDGSSYDSGLVVTDYAPNARVEASWESSDMPGVITSVKEVRGELEELIATAYLLLEETLILDSDDFYDSGSALWVHTLRKWRKTVEELDLAPDV